MTTVSDTLTLETRRLAIATAFMEGSEPGLILDDFLVAHPRSRLGIARLTAKIAAEVVDAEVATLRQKLERAKTYAHDEKAAANRFAALLAETGKVLDTEAEYYEIRLSAVSHKVASNPAVDGKGQNFKAIR